MFLTDFEFDPHASLFGMEGDQGEAHHAHKKARIGEKDGRDGHSGDPVNHPRLRATSLSASPYQSEAKASVRISSSRCSPAFLAPKVEGAHVARGAAVLQDSSEEGDQPKRVVLNSLERYCIELRCNPVLCGCVAGIDDVHGLHRRSKGTDILITIHTHTHSLSLSLSLSFFLSFFLNLSQGKKRRIKVEFPPASRQRPRSSGQQTCPQGSHS